MFCGTPPQKNLPEQLALLSEEALKNQCSKKIQRSPVEFFLFFGEHFVILEEQPCDVTDVIFVCMYSGLWFT